jgi:hypothetical protein
VSFAILTTGVRAFEWSFSSLRSAFVHSRRLPVFLAALAFFKLIAPVDHEGRLLPRNAQQQVDKHELRMSGTKNQISISARPGNAPSEHPITTRKPEIMCAAPPS